jgi:hypothetical protein
LNNEEEDMMHPSHSPSVKIPYQAGNRMRLWKSTFGTSLLRVRVPGKGSIAYADGMLYCLGEKGNMGLLEANPDAFKMVSMFQLPKGEGPCWAHPVISGGKLYLRWSDNLYVYDIKK